jgi:hypothetical protein
MPIPRADRDPNVELFPPFGRRAVHTLLVLGFEPGSLEITSRDGRTFRYPPGALDRAVRCDERECREVLR